MRLLLFFTLVANALLAQPVAPSLPKTTTIFGESITDPYYGMRNRQDQQVLDYLKAENKYTAQQTRSTLGLQKQLVRELRQYVPVQDSSFPYFYHGYWYVDYYTKNGDYPLAYRKKGSLGAAKELVMDEAAMLKKHKAYSISSYDFSYDNEWMSYGVDFTGNFESTVFFKDLTPANRIINDKIPMVTGLAWSRDSKYVYYSCQDSVTNRSYRVYRHKLGTDTAQDELLFEEKDKEFEVGIWSSKDDEYLFVSSEASDENEIWFLPLADNTAKLRLFAARQEKHLYYPQHAKGTFYIQSNYNGKINNQIYTCSSDKTEIKDWAIWLEHRDNVYLLGMDIFDKYLITEENINGTYSILVYDLATKKGEVVQIPGISEKEYGVYNWGMNVEMNSDTFRFSYNSMRLPHSIYSYHAKDKTVKKWWSMEYENYNADDYISERIWAKSADGVEVPLTLIYHIETNINEAQPCLLEAYGSYGASSPPTFSRTVMPLVDRGWIYAIAHVRGGDDLGKHWYLNGKLLQKKNTFNDFIACTEALIAKGYTSPKKMTATGASAGGLLMGAIVNQRPDLYKAVILGVPFVDVMNTMLDPDLPLTVLEYNEWGNPNDKTYYDYMRSYSPYDNVKAQDYPNMLFLGGFTDEQVGYWEPTKMVAKLRKTKTDNNQLLLKVNMDAGHWGTPGRYSMLGQIAFEWAFLVNAVQGK